MSPSSRRVIRFVNIAHIMDHWFMLIFPTAVLGMGGDFGLGYGELIALATGGFIAFGAGSLPSGWIGDHWSRRNMLAVFFVGLGLATLATGFSREPWQLALGLTVIGLFASIYHPVGSAMLVGHAERVGREIGVNGVWGNMGVASAALVTGAVTEWLGWRWAFVLPGALAMGTGLLYVLAVPDEGNRQGARKTREASFPRAVVVRVFSALLLAALTGGIVFNATTVALPKLFDERMPDLSGSTFGIGTLVFLVYVIGAMSQLVMGKVIDRYPLKIGFLPLALCQAPLLFLASVASGWMLVAVAVAMIFTIFGQVTINDGMVARYAAPAWRARAYAIRYLITFSASAFAVPLVAAMHGWGGFSALFALLGALGLVLLSGALLFPYRPDEIPDSETAAPSERVQALAE